MEVFRADVKSGVFILVAFAIFVVTVFNVGNILDRFGSNPTVTLNFDDSQQVEEGTELLYRGKKVGRVSEVAFADDGRSVDIRCALTGATPLFRGMHARIADKSMLGGKIIELLPPVIEAGVAPVPLEPGEVIPGLPPYGLTAILDGLSEAAPLYKDRLDRLLVKIETLVDSTNQTMINANSLVSDFSEIKPKLVDTIASYDQLGKQLEIKLAHLSDKMQKVMDELLPGAKGLEEQFTGLAVSLRADLADLKGQIDETLSQVRVLMTDADRLLVDQYQPLDDTLATLQRTVHNLEVFSERIATRPSALVFSKKRPIPEKPDGPGPSEAGANSVLEAEQENLDH